MFNESLPLEENGLSEQFTTGNRARDLRLLHENDWFVYHINKSEPKLAVSLISTGLLIKNLWIIKAHPIMFNSLHDFALQLNSTQCHAPIRSRHSIYTFSVSWLSHKDSHFFWWRFGKNPDPTGLQQKPTVFCFLVFPQVCSSSVLTTPTKSLFLPAPSD